MKWFEEKENLGSQNKCDLIWTYYEIEGEQVYNSLIINYR